MNGFRHENKYFISQAGYRMLRSRLAAMLQADPNSGRADGQYFIRSLYFDDAMQSALIDKEDGIQDREKFRIRFYNMDPSFIRLESKQKWTDLVKKESAPLTREETEKILSGDLWDLYSTSYPLLRNFYLKSRTRFLRPAVIVDYTREAYVFEDVRITFDMDIHSGLYRTDLFSPGLPTVPVLPDSQVVLEVKFEEALPDAVFQLLRAVPAARSAISKYELCRQYQ